MYVWRSTSDSDYVKIVALAVSTAVLGLSTFVLAAVVFFLYMMKQVCMYCMYVCMCVCN